MSMTNAQLTQAIMGLSKSIYDLNLAVDERLKRIGNTAHIAVETASNNKARIYQIEQSMKSNEALQWTAIGQRAISKDVWGKFSSLETREANQNQYIEDFKKAYYSRNADISKQLVDLGKMGGGGGNPLDFLGGALAGVGTTTLILVGLGAYLVMKKK